MSVRRRRWITRKRSSSCGPLGVLFGAVLAIAMTAVTASATPPGGNGAIVFRRYFTSDHSSGALFVADLSGTAIKQITHPRRQRVLDTEPDWSPDGTRIAFQRNDRSGCGPNCETAEIWVVDADGRNATAIAKDPRSKGCANHDRAAGGFCRGDPAWSPDGKRIIFACGTLPTATKPETERFCVTAADGSKLTRLPSPPRGAQDYGPQWSPNGNKIAFERRLVSRTGETLRTAIFVMNSDGSDARRITPWPLRGGDHPDWSPDGRTILFRSNHEGSDRITGNLYVVRPDGTALRQLTRARGGVVQHLSSSFSPDGRWITFAKTPGKGRAGNADVFVMRADGTGIRNVTRSAIWDSAPDWGSGR